MANNKKQQLNITCRTDVVLHDRLIFDGETFDPSLSVGIVANLVTSMGKRNPLDVEVDGDELVISIPWVEGRNPGCYGIEVTGTCNSKKWSTYADSLIRYTKATKHGAGEVTVESDYYDITMEVGYRYGEGGNVNDVLVNGESVVQAGKARITVPTKVSDLENDADYATQEDVEESKISEVEATIDDNVGTPEVEATLTGNKLTFAFQNLLGDGIASIEQTTTSEESEGINVVTATTVGGNVATFQVRNGAKGDTVILGEGVEYTLYNGTGSNTDGAMTQKAVTDAMEEVGRYEYSLEYVKLVTDSAHKIIYGIKANGDFYFGAGCPPQVKDYILSKIADIPLEEYDRIVDFVDGLEQGDLTLQQLLNGKVDEVSGQSLINSEYASCQEVVSDQDWIQAITDSNGRVLEGINADGEKYIGMFDSDTKQTIKEIVDAQSSSPIINIPLIDENFTSPVPCTVTGTKGDENAKYEFSLDLKSAFNIRFKFRVTENLINQDKTAVIAKLNGSNCVTAVGVSLSQQTSAATYNGETKTNYWPCLTGGLRLNGGSVSSNYNNKHIGHLAFSVKYTGSENNATIENTGTALVIKIGSVTHSFAYTTYPTVSELYEAVKLINDIEVNYKNLENKNSDELAVFSESKLKTTMYTGINGASGAPIVEYIDAAEFMLPYAVDDTWHNAEIVKIGDVVYCSCDGFMNTFSMTGGSSSTLTIGGDCGVLFKELQIASNSSLDAEIVDGNLISSINPYIIVYEGHGIDKVPSVEAETTGNMNTTIDRLQFVFERLKKKGYIPVSIHDIAEYYNGNRNLPKRCYTLIFDDLRFDNVLDIDNMSVFTSFGVKPALAIISDRMGDPTRFPIMHNGVAISADKAVEISKMHNFDLVSHTNNHRANDAVKPSEMIGKLIEDNYSGDMYGVNSEILVFPYGRTNPYLFWAMSWLGYKLGVNVWSGNYSHRNGFSRTKYNLVRYEIGMREDMGTIIELMR